MRPRIARSNDGREDGSEEDKDDSRQRRDEAMVGVFEVNQEADDLEDEGELEDYQEDVNDNRTGELLDAKLSMRAENEGPKRNAGPRQNHQVGSRELGNIVKPLHQSQARGKRLQHERRRILVCGHAAS